jgi:hypothetical protein
VPSGIFTQQKKRKSWLSVDFFRRRKVIANSKYSIQKIRYDLCRSTCTSARHDLISIFFTAVKYDPS